MNAYTSKPTTLREHKKQLIRLKKRIEEGERSISKVINELNRLIDSYPKGGGEKWTTH